MEIFTILLEPFYFLSDPHKRIFWLYWLSALLLAFLLSLRKNPSFLSFIKQLFHPQHWFTHSSRVDIQWLLTNHYLRSLFVVPLLGSQIALAMVTFRFLQGQFGHGDFWAWPPFWTHALFTLIVFVLDDASRCLLHWAYHKIPILWRFHAVHHAANHLTPLTLYRIHPLEMVLNSIRSLWVIGSISGLFMYLFAGSISLVSIAGVSIFNGVFHLLGANLRHSHIWLGFGRLEKWFISPAQHQIHHSQYKKHWDKNFGASLAIWDRLLGSWLSSKEETVEKFGLDGVHKQSYWRDWLGIKPRP